MKFSRNSEGYADPTVGAALYNIQKEERRRRRERRDNKNTVRITADAREELTHNDTERVKDGQTLGELPSDAG